MAADRDDIVALARTIGPRLSGGPQERRASHYVLDRLQSIGLPATLLPVRIPRTFAPTYIILFFVLAVTVPLFRLLEFVAIAISLAAFVVLALEVASRPVLSRRVAVGNGSNVLGLIPASAAGELEEPERRVIVTAHLDSGRSGVLWRAPWVHHFRLVLMAVLISATLIPVLLIAAALLDLTLVWLLAFIPAVILIAAALLLLERDNRGRPVPGANDNASGVAAALAVATALQHEPPRHVESWFLFTAGQEAGLAGMTRFLAENHFDPERTYFVVLDTVGSGRIHYTSSEGMLIPVASSPALQRIAGEVASAHPDWLLRPHAHRLLPTDQTAALARGYQAIALLGYNTRGELPNWHEPSDTVEHVNLTTVQTAVDLTVAMIRRLDQEVDEGIAQRSSTATGQFPARPPSATQ